MPPPGENIISTYRLNDGYGTLDNPEKFLQQDYEALTSYCLNQGVMFVDDEFPPDITSIGEGALYSDDLDLIEWMRPGELSSNPSFTLDGVTRFDYGQGLAANSWLLAPLGAMTSQPDFLERVVYLDQSFDENYCGLFHFRFWRFGTWVDVVIDDKLPTIDGQLIFVRSNNPDEFWSPLFEKAYAKVCGSYEDLNSGFASEALKDFSGCVHVHVTLSEPPSNLWDLMSRASQSKSMMVCSMTSTCMEELEAPVLPNGLVVDHGYTVIGVKQVISGDEDVNLVHLWNPWCTGEWTGDWSDMSPLWDTVSPEDREGLHVDDDGDFWMTLEDFIQFYTDLDICSESPDFLDGSPSGQWKTSVHDGRWVAGTTAGGRIDLESYWMNPQFWLKVGNPPSDQVQTQEDKNMLLSLMQKPDVRNRLMIKSLHIGFNLFKVTEKYKTWTGRFPAAFFTENEPVGGAGLLINLREVTELLWLEPGDYLIVPSTYAQDETASFILTIVSKVETDVQENSDGHFYEPMEGGEVVKGDDESKVDFSRQLSGKHEEVTAEELQGLLNQKILKGRKKSGGFSLESCRSMVAQLDDIFDSTDVSKKGTLSLSELQEALLATGIRVPEELRDLLPVRYGMSSGQMTLENFIFLALRLYCMNNVFSQLLDKITMEVKLHEEEWLHLALYT